MKKWVQVSGNIKEVECEWKPIGKNPEAYVAWVKNGRTEISVYIYNTEREAYEDMRDTAETTVQYCDNQLRRIGKELP